MTRDGRKKMSTATDVCNCYITLDRQQLIGCPTEYLLIVLERKEYGEITVRIAWRYSFGHSHQPPTHALLVAAFVGVVWVRIAQFHDFLWDYVILPIVVSH